MAHTTYIKYESTYAPAPLSEPVNKRDQENHCNGNSYFTNVFRCFVPRGNFFAFQKVVLLVYVRVHVNVQKIGFLSQTRKLRSNNKICFDENDCNETSVFSWTYWDLARTNKTSEYVHFIW